MRSVPTPTLKEKMEVKLFPKFEEVFDNICLVYMHADVLVKNDSKAMDYKTTLNTELMYSHMQEKIKR